MQDVEDILNTWESTGILEDCPDRLNLALILETQKKVNESILADFQPNEDGWQFQRVSITAILNVCKQQIDLFQGVVTQECKDVYRLGYMPRGNDVDVCLEIVNRILKLDRDSPDIGCLYFGGLIFKEGRLYLLADPVE